MKISKKIVSVESSEFKTAIPPQHETRTTSRPYTRISQSVGKAHFKYTGIPTAENLGERDFSLEDRTEEVEFDVHNADLETTKAIADAAIESKRLDLEHKRRLKRVEKGIPESVTIHNQTISGTAHGPGAIGVAMGSIYKH